MSVAAAVLMCLATAGSAATASESQGTWKAGIATVVTTPEQPMWMAGYAARNKPSEGKVHDLHAKALALEDAAGTRFVMVTMDVIGFPREFRDAVEKEVGARYGLRPEALLLNASHTHCGPEIRAWRATQAWDLPAEQIELGRKYAEIAAGQGRRSRGPGFEGPVAGAVVLHAWPLRGRHEPAFADRAAGMPYRPMPMGPVDHDVPVLLVTTPDGKTTRAILFGYACHNTTLDFYQFCGDYAGFAQLVHRRGTSGDGRPVRAAAAGATRIRRRGARSNGRSSMGGRWPTASSRLWRRSLDRCGDR